MRRVLYKLPGKNADERRIATHDAAIRELIGCTYETRFEWTDDGWGPTAIISANQHTASALRYPEHIWFYTGTIRGPIILINRLSTGQYLDLTDDDVARWRVKLQEFEHSTDTGFEHSVFTAEVERQERRSHSIGQAVAQNDDFAAVLRLQAEVEQRVRERTLKKLPHPERLGRSLRFDLRQAVAIAAALGAIPQEYVKLITALGEMRNRFAHEPGFVLSPEGVSRLKETAESSGLDDTRWAFDQSVDETVDMSEEGRDLRMIYSHLISWLDDEIVAYKDGWPEVDLSVP